MWRDVLSFADASGDGLARARLAWSLAQHHGAHLEIDVVAAETRPLYAVDPRVLAAVLEAIRGTVEAEAQRAAAVLRDAVGGESGRVSVHVKQAFESDVRPLAARAARTADLVVVPQPEAADGSALDTDIFLGALLGGGRPCLMVPRGIEAASWGKRALIAWKGAPEASRAVLGALPLLQGADSVRICLVNPRSEREGEDGPSLARLVAYLLRHNVKVEIEPAVRESRDSAELTILGEAEAFNADLLVMGAYSRPRLQQIVFGGVTAAVLRSAQMPVLMWH